jgi:F-type H+-transporting ATPase subunit b
LGGIVCAVVFATAGAPCGAAEAAEDASHAADAHGGGHEDLGHGNATAGLSDASQFRTDLAIYTFAVFMLLLAILSQVAWPKISDALTERERRIADALAAADAKHEQAKQLLVEHEAKLATAADEVRAMLEEARRDAESTRQEIVAEAQQAADVERQRCLRDIDRAADSAMKNLAETSANLAIQLASQVIHDELKSAPQKQSELVRVALSQLTSSDSHQN